MFRKASVVVAIALSILASAVPRAPVEHDGGDAHTRIPLRNRATFVRSDGTFDMEKAAAHTVAVHNKHRQNLISLERNVGREAFNPGAEIKPLAVPPPQIRKRQADVALTDENDILWYGDVSIGTPGQGFLIDFDTGSADLWVPSSECTSNICSQKNKYNASSSSTSQREPGYFSIEYGDGSTVSGPVYTDTGEHDITTKKSTNPPYRLGTQVSVAGVVATKQYFSPVTTLSNGFEGIDGILGLAFPSLSNIGKPPFIYTASHQGSLRYGEFCFKLAPTGSELSLGGPDAAMYTGRFENYFVNSQTGFWQLSGGRAYVGKNLAVFGFGAIIDSGTTIMYGPPSAVEELYSKIPGSALYDAENGFYSFPCDSDPSISFSWGWKHWQISESNFNLGLTSDGSSQCVGALAAQDLGLGSNVWLLGDSFMKNVYTCFNVGSNSIGLAELV